MSNHKGILANWNATGEEIRLAIREGIQIAMHIHKEKGVEMVTWRDGQIVLIPPEEIEVPEDADEVAHDGSPSPDTVRPD